MQDYRLSFGIFIDHGNGVLEAIVDEGIDISVEHVQEIIALAERIEPRPQLLLANRKNAYSFSFAAVRFISVQKTFKAVAVITKRQPWLILGRVLEPQFFKLATFADRDRAVAWLRSNM